MASDFREQAQRLVAAAAAATAGSPNEENLRAEIEKALERACSALELPWTAFQLDRTLRGEEKGTPRFVDVAHGAVVIEYEPPQCFNAGRAEAAVTHAKGQAEDYAKLLSEEEGRPLTEYVVVAWDGAYISFGRHTGDEWAWDPVTPFELLASERLLTHLREDGTPLVHPMLISQLVGPRSELGARLLPELFDAITRAASDKSTNKTRLLFTEWRRLFGQVIGVQSERLRELLEDQGRAHGAPYESDVAPYLFSLNTYMPSLPS